MRKSRLIMAGVGITFMSTAAISGFVQPFPVEVDLTTRIANGDMVTARYSADDNVFIGCGIRKISDGVGGIFSFGFCQAEDAAEEQITCNTTDEGLLDAISSSGEFGFVTFSWDEDDVCTRIGFSNQSFYIPKKLKSNE